MSIESIKFVPDTKQALEAARKRKKKVIVIPDIEGASKIYEEAKRKGITVIKATGKTIKGDLGGMDCDLLMLANGNALYNPKTGEYEFKKILSKDSILNITAGNNVFGNWKTIIVTYESGAIEVSSIEELQRVCEEHKGDIVKFALDGNTENQELQAVIDSLHTSVLKSHNGMATAYQTGYVNKQGEKRTRVDISPENTKFTGLLETIKLHPELAGTTIRAYAEGQDNNIPLAKITSIGGYYVAVTDTTDPNRVLSERIMGDIQSEFTR